MNLRYPIRWRAECACGWGQGFYDRADAVGASWGHGVLKGAAHLAVVVPA